MLVLSPLLFPQKHFLGLPHSAVRLHHRPVSLTGEELAGLSREIYDMLGCPYNIKIRLWEFKGELDSFEDDVIVGDPIKFLKFLRKEPEKEL